MTDEQLVRLRETLAQHRGSCPAYLHVIVPGSSETVIELPESLRVVASEAMLDAVENIFAAALRYSAEPMDILRAFGSSTSPSTKPARTARRCSPISARTSSRSNGQAASRPHQSSRRRRRKRLLSRQQSRQAERLPRFVEGGGEDCGTSARLARRCARTQSQAGRDGEAGSRLRGSAAAQPAARLRRGIDVRPERVDQGFRRRRFDRPSRERSHERHWLASRRRASRRRRGSGCSGGHQFGVFRDGCPFRTRAHGRGELVQVSLVGGLLGLQAWEMQPLPFRVRPQAEGVGVIRSSRPYGRALAHPTASLSSPR